MVVTTIKYYLGPVLWLNIYNKDLSKNVKPGDLALNFAPISALDSVWKTLPPVVRKLRVPFLPGHARNIVNWVKRTDLELIYCPDREVGLAVWAGLYLVGNVSDPRTLLPDVLTKYAFIADLIACSYNNRRVSKIGNASKTFRVRDVKEKLPTIRIPRTVDVPLLGEDFRAPTVRPRRIPLRD